MSYLDDRPRQRRLAPMAPLATVLLAPGCVQCGAKLERDGLGLYGHSGKCQNCADFVTDDDEIFDDLED